MFNVIFFVILALLVTVSTAGATPTQSGPTGLLTVPTADTVDAGNICVGIWGNYRSNKTGNTPRDAFIAPASITIGISPFWEMYGTYPNLLFNGKEEASGRGTADVGTKLRFIGKRSSYFKLAADMFLQRHISEDPAIDGNVDKGARIVASLRRDRIGMHLYGGYVLTSAPPGISYNDEVVYGGGVEVSPLPRAKFTVELFGNKNRDRQRGNPLEGMVGLQYYLSPHLTMNLGGGVGFSNSSPEWRALFGLSTCQGVGTYIKPVPKLVQASNVATKKNELKPVRIIPISPLLSATGSPLPSSSLEVSVGPNTEEVLIIPYGQISLPATPAIPQGATKDVPVVPPNDKPTKQDTDGASGKMDGSPLFGVRIEGQEVAISGTVPAKLPERMVVYRKFRFPDAAFDYDQWSLSEEGKRYISQVGEQVRNDKRWMYIRVDGYSDNIGSENYNLDLSIKRAIAVTTQLVSSEGIDAARIFIKGMGSSNPLSDNSLAEGRKFNRRCELLLLVPR